MTTAGVRTKRSTYARGIASAAAGGISWGLSGACSQYLFMHYDLDSGWLAAVRMVYAGIILTGLALLRKDRALSGILKNRGDALQLFAFSLAGLLSCQYAFLAAIKHSNSGTATVLQSLSVVMLAVFLSIRSRALPGKKQLVSVLLALAGVYLIATNGTPGHLVLSFSGLFWGIATAAGGAIYTLLSQRIVIKWGYRAVTGLGMLIGGTVLFIAAKAWQIPPSLDLRALAVIAVIVIIGTAGAFCLFLQGVGDIGPMNAALIACLEPVTATVITVIWLHTSFNAADIIGFCCILATVFLSVRSN